MLAGSQVLALRFPSIEKQARDKFRAANCIQFEKRNLTKTDLRRVKHFEADKNVTAHEFSRVCHPGVNAVRKFAKCVNQVTKQSSTKEFAAC